MSTQPQPVGLTEAQQLSLVRSWRMWWDYEITRPSGGGPIARILQIARRWEVVRELIARGLKVKYSDSVLGYAWSLIQPLLLIGVYWLVFGHVARYNLTHYPLFIAAGMMPWLFFNDMIQGSLTTLTANSGIIRTINLPREIFTVAEVGQQIIEYVLTLPVVLVVGLLYGVLPTRNIVLLPLAVGIEAILVVGAGLFLAVANALLRDVARLVRVFLRVWFYLSPIVYPASRFTGIAGTVYKLNPLVGIVGLNRIVWYPHYLGITRTVALQQAGYSAVASLLILVLGWTAFIKLEAATLKEI